MAAPFPMNTTESIQAGWAEVDILPTTLPVVIAGQFPARLSEGVGDPLVATALALERGGEAVVFVACDLICISEELRDATRAQLADVPGLDPRKVIFHATHTHAGPECRGVSPVGGSTQAGGYGVELGARPTQEYSALAAQRLARAVRTAWESRADAVIAFGLDYAVIGRNRRWGDAGGRSAMYGLKPEAFRYVEGYEDHSLNLLAVYDAAGRLTGLVVNLPCPSQADGMSFLLSADFWHETRGELRRRFGEHLYILPQVSAAGELTSHLLYGQAAEERMRGLRGRTVREEIAHRIADAVGRILPVIRESADSAPALQHRVETLSLPLNPLTNEARDEAVRAGRELDLQYQEELRRLEADPAARGQPRWYLNATGYYRQRAWHLGVVRRHELMQTTPVQDVEVHAVRLGEIAFATNPFELYLDYGIQIKVRSPAIQTFLVQLAGSGTYLPSARSVSGGGYGSAAPSNPFGPEAGEKLVDATARLIHSLWAGSPPSPNP